NGPKTGTLRTARNSAAAFFWASSYFSGGIGGRRSCAAAAVTCSRDAKITAASLLGSASDMAPPRQAANRPAGQATRDLKPTRTPSVNPAVGRTNGSGKAMPASAPAPQPGCFLTQPPKRLLKAARTPSILT